MVVERMSPERVVDAGDDEHFKWSLHSMSTHTVRFEGADRASRTLHVLARYGVDFEGTEELMDVGAAPRRR